jgi:hypothetical protein
VFVLFIIWPLSLRKKPEIVLFKNKVLRKEYNNDVSVMNWKQLYSEGVYNLCVTYWQLRWIFGEDLKENQGKKMSEMSPLERSWRCGRTF